MSEPKKRGRPPKPYDEVRRHSVGIRTTRELASRIRVAASMSGRSQAGESEYRLQKSFEADPILEALTRIEDLLRAKS